MKNESILVLGLDGLGYENLRIHHQKNLPSLNKLCDSNTCVKLKLDVGISCRNWVRIFSGVDLKWYNLYIKQIDKERDVWRLIKRSELPVEFIWDLYPDMIVINAPVVIPPICRNTGFKPVGYGMPLTYFEMWRELNGVRRHTLKALETGKPIVSVITIFDRLLHIAGGENIVRLTIELDEVVRMIIDKAIQYGYNWIIVSDHGMKRISSEDRGVVAPRHDMPYIKTVTKAIHEHDDTSLFISNLDVKPNTLIDVYGIIKQNL